jgi:transportin-1
MPVLIENINPDHLSVCNNASWAIGEITVKVGAELMAPFVEHILAKLVAIINNPDINTALLENTAITIGRLAKVCPNLIAPSMGTFLYNWLLSLQHVKCRSEKEHAFEGLCLAIQQNPNVLLSPDGQIDTFEAFGWAVASW